MMRVNEKLPRSRVMSVDANNKIIENVRLFDEFSFKFEQIGIY
jgi:hypothetical protein